MRRVQDWGNFALGRAVAARSGSRSCRPVPAHRLDDAGPARPRRGAIRGVERTRGEASAIGAAAVGALHCSRFKADPQEL
jgi:hypothetical protein